MKMHVEALTRFAESHLPVDADNALIRLKIEHSLKVLDNARAIVLGEALPGPTARLCLLCALYHDIGRFPQLARYGTFNDRESINHGRAGVLALRAFDMPGDITERDARVIRFSVGQHNLKSVRSTLPERLVHPVHVVRDADKLDIYRIMIDHFRSDEPNPMVTMGMDSDPDAYSDALYEAVLAGRNGDYSDIRHANDFLLLLIGWASRVHYAATLDLILSRGHLEAIFSLLPGDSRIRALEEKTHAFIRYKTGSPS
ncbi:MAG: HD domain-containing protein [Pseudodesulfovibrio sp.]